MGCCISKCRPENNNNHSLEHHHHQHHQFNHNVQDKLVVSQAPPPLLLPKSPPVIIPHNRSSKYKISPSPPSPTASSTSSVSSFTCTANSNTTISSASSLSSASYSSSAATLKDRSFSNEFLWSCYKDNPHIIRINSLTEATLPLTMNTKPKPGLAPTPPLKQNSPKQQNVVVGSSFSTMPQKRVRSNSPTNLTRQKSFRKEQPERPVRTTLGSPSPSRRFSNEGDKCGSALATSVSKRMNSCPKVSAVRSRSVSSSLRKEGVNKGASPNNNSSSLGRLQYCGLRHRETRLLRVGSKIDETVVKDVLSNNHDMDIDLTEDIDNPLISLDCFIFL